MSAGKDQIEGEGIVGVSGVSRTFRRHEFAIDFGAGNGFAIFQFAAATIDVNRKIFPIEQATDRLNQLQEIAIASPSFGLRPVWRFDDLTGDGIPYTDDGGH